MAEADDFRVALDKSLQKLNREGLQIKDIKQYDALRSMVVERKDTVCNVLVISPLNTIPQLLRLSSLTCHLYYLF